MKSRFSKLGQSSKKKNVEASLSCEKIYGLVSVLVRGALFQGVGEVEVKVGGPSTSVQLQEFILDNN